MINKLPLSRIIFSLCLILSIIASFFLPVSVLAQSQDQTAAGVLTFSLAPATQAIDSQPNSLAATGRSVLIVLVSIFL